MTFAWYGHLKYRQVPLFKVIVISWLIAFLEYCFQVPANRIGSDVLSLTQLKIIQEILSLLTFVGVAFFLYKERPTMNHAISFMFIIGAAYFAVKK